MSAEPDATERRAGESDGEWPAGLGLRWTAALVACGACAAVAGAAFLRLGALGASSLGVGVVAAGLAGGWLRRWRRGMLCRIEAAEAEAASLRDSVRQAQSEITALQERLREANRLAAVGTMSAQIAHQLRNPLTSIQLYVQLLEDELRQSSASGSGEALNLVELVLNELKALVEITDNYLQYARLPEPEPAPVDVNRAVGELVRFLRPEFARKGITVSARLPDGLPAVRADRRLLRLALMNLLKNAIEAMGPGGRLRVKTCQQNGSVEIHVADTGSGIAASEAERVFEPFYTTKDSGSGLGLSLSRQIVEKLDGSLTFQSMVGLGTTFVVRLPVRTVDWSGNHGREDPDSVDRG